MPKRTHDGVKKRCGCSKRQWPKCSHPWWFSFFYRGTEHRYSLDKIASARNEPAPTSKADAIKWRDRLRNEIRFGTFSELTPPAPAEPTRLTFGDVCEEYLKRYVRVPTRRDTAVEMFAIHIGVLRRAEIPAPGDTTMKLEAKPIDAITKADVEAVRMWRRAQLAARAPKVRRPGSKQGEVGINRLLARLRHLFNWAIAEGYVTDSPFKRHGVTVVRLEHKAEGPRTRRLVAVIPGKDGEEDTPSEEDRLLAHAEPHLRALIVAALSTGCRLGELLSLEWRQIQSDGKGEARWLILPAEQTKTGEPRVIPIGPRLRAELVMRRDGPDGEPLPLSARVFGNEVGEPIESIRESWERTCAAAGIAGLHFHDLRREFACRLLESSADLHDVRDFLGHANITTTSTYLRSTPVRLARALDRLDPEPPKPPQSSDSPDSHTIRTNPAVHENGQPERPAVTH